jgi:hypothetical protein
VPKSASELYRPKDGRLLANSVPNFADRGCHVVSVTAYSRPPRPDRSSDRVNYIPASSVSNSAWPACSAPRWFGQGSRCSWSGTLRPEAKPKCRPSWAESSQTRPVREPACQSGCSAYPIVNACILRGSRTTRTCESKHANSSEVKLPSACSFIVDGLMFSCRCSTLFVSAYMAIFRCVWIFFSFIIPKGICFAAFVARGYTTQFLICAVG